MSSEAKWARERRQLSSRQLGVISIVFILIIWQLVSLVAGRNQAGEHVVPNLIDIVGAVKKLGYYWQGGLGVQSTETGGSLTWAGAGLAFVYGSVVTLLRLVVGLLLGTIVGVVGAALVSWSRLLRRVFAPVGHVARMLPTLALLPLFLLWFGNSDTGAILFVALSTFVLIFMFALTAIGQVPTHYEDYALSLGASRLRAYVSVVLPASLPSLGSGLLLAVGFAWSAVIGAEFLGQQHGLGVITHLAETFGQISILTLVGAIVVLYAAISYLLTKRVIEYLTRWAE